MEEDYQIVAVDQSDNTVWQAVSGDIHDHNTLYAANNACASSYTPPTRKLSAA